MEGKDKSCNALHQLTSEVLDEVKKEFKFECFSYFSMFASPSGNQIIRVTQEGYNPPKNF